MQTNSLEIQRGVFYRVQVTVFVKIITTSYTLFINTSVSYIFFQKKFAKTTIERFLRLRFGLLLLVLQYVCVV